MDHEWTINERLTDSRFQHEINDIKMFRSQVTCFPQGNLMHVLHDSHRLPKSMDIYNTRRTMIPISWIFNYLFLKVYIYYTLILNKKDLNLI